MNFNIKKSALIKILILLAIYTTSFDIFLNVSFVGLSFRFTQFIIMPVFIIYFKEILDTGFKLTPKEITMIACFIVQFVMSLRSPDMGNAIGYLMWFAFDILTVFAVYNFCGIYYSKQWLIKTYINSFFFISIFGLIQFFAYLIGINILVTQTWFPHKIARINGFCYEPSYYSTYLLISFVMLAYLIEKKIEIAGITNRSLKYKFIFITISLILSSSRMGILMISLWIAFRFIVWLKQILFGKISYIKLMLLFIIAPLTLVSLILFIKIYWYKLNLNFLISGLGIYGASAHSANDRINGLLTCLHIFAKSPILGYGFGGVDPIIAVFKGIEYTNNLNGMAMSIVGELLIANGILGLIPFCVFIMLIIKDYKKSNNCYKALFYAFIFEIMILCFNQNILRPYVWMHIALLFVSQKE